MVWDEALGRSTKIIVPFATGRDGALPLYCVHALSGAVSTLGELALLLGPEQPFFAIQAPVGMRNAQFGSSIESMAQYYVDALVAFQPTGPLVLGGWSVGSIIALEMARELRARGRDDILLVNIDCELFTTGGGLSRRNPVYHAKVLRNFPRWLSYELREKKLDWPLLRKRLVKKVAATVKVVWSGVAGGRIDRGHAVGGFMDTSAFPADRKAFMTTLYDTLFRFVPAPYAGPVVIYEAVVQPVGHLRQVGATWRKICDPEVVQIMGNHASIIKAPDGIALAEHLRRRLTQFASARNEPTHMVSRERRDSAATGLLSQAGAMYQGLGGLPTA